MDSTYTCFTHKALDQTFDSFSFIKGNLFDKTCVYHNVNFGKCHTSLGDICGEHDSYPRTRCKRIANRGLGCGRMQLDDFVLLGEDT